MSDQPHHEAREVLTNIAFRRDNLAAERRQWVAIAWRGGDRNINALADAADVSRNTIYADLKAQGLDRSTPVEEES